MGWSFFLRTLLVGFEGLTLFLGTVFWGFIAQVLGARAVNVSFASNV